VQQQAAQRLHLHAHGHARARDPTLHAIQPNPAPSTQAVNAMLDYGRKLQHLAGEDDLVPGLGMPSLRGGDWESEAKRRDVREVFRTFVDQSVDRAVR
jgi:hypothetical protein